MSRLAIITVVKINGMINTAVPSPWLEKPLLESVTVIVGKIDRMIELLTVISMRMRMMDWG